MNILYIAYSCDPNQGSEDKIGWCVPVQSAKTNRVFVVTKEEHREAIERYLTDHALQNIDFYFVDIPRVYKKVFKSFLYSGRLNIWHRRALPIVKEICKEHNIDIIHQITPVEYRAIGEYQAIQTAKFVCGPIGGGEYVPAGLNRYIRGHRGIETIRAVINKWYRFALKATGKLAHSDYIMFANRETCQSLNGNCKQNYPYEICSEIGIGDHELRAEACPIPDAVSDRDRRCIFLVAGRMIYRKGHAFLLDALAGLPAELEYECRMIGGGPELARLQKRCADSEVLAKHVVFTGPIPYSEMEKEYDNADVFIMPSIRETTGTVLLEAMSKGLPVITINKFGGAILLDNKSGWLYGGQDEASYLAGIRQAILECIRIPGEIRNRGLQARKQAEQYTWDRKCQHYQEIYCQLLDK